MNWVKGKQNVQILLLTCLMTFDVYLLIVGVLIATRHVL